MWMLFLAFYELFVGVGRNLALRSYAIIGLYELAVAVFVVLAIFFAPDWWYSLVAVGIALLSILTACAINAIINRGDTDTRLVNLEGIPLDDFTYMGVKYDNFEKYSLAIREDIEGKSAITIFALVLLFLLAPACIVLMYLCLFGVI